MLSSEFFGRADFEHPTPPDLELLNRHFQNLDQDYASVHIPAAKGEWLKELHERVDKALTKIVTDLDNDSEQPKTVLICTHAATMVSRSAATQSVLNRFMHGGRGPPNTVDSRLLLVCLTARFHQ